MIRSMTGYGQGSRETDALRITVEVRSVNHRFSDIRVRLPSILAQHERAIKQQVQKRVRRGRVEGSIHLEPSGVQGEALINQPLVEQVVAASKVLQDRYAIAGELTLASVLQLPGVLRADAGEAWDDERVEDLLAAVAEAVDNLDADRCREGASIANDLRERADAMQELAAQVRERVKSIPSQLKQRLEERLAQLGDGVAIDPQRVAQEAVLLADRADVTEEVVRLDGHLVQLHALLDETGDDPRGKRLEFLVQEILRETNTINSKSSDLTLSQVALGLKAETEKVREQIQNVE